MTFIHKFLPPLHRHHRLRIPCLKGVHVRQDQIAGAVATECFLVFAADDRKSA